ncbi:MAG: proteasome accessory factor PafA2 family protein [Planctomycetes bacterium]|nr:proteasome accessory factor PafA2 family protein [Planctomycetota bacterium]MBL7038977.1 proteasome accessory factor PafA2 family protein [Pirellulaceae bacterium]
MAIPKRGGRDCEFSTTGVDAAGRSIDPWKVTRNILRQIGPALAAYGAKAWSRQTRSRGYGYGSYATQYSSDCLRSWTSAGQCYYSDMAHYEAASATSLAPKTFAAQCLSTVLAGEAARKLAEEEADEGETYDLTTSNADLLDPSISFGTHLNVQVHSSLWEDIIREHRHPAILGYVTSALAAAIPFFGAGYLLPLNDGTTIYSLSARAHHLSKIKTLSTTQAFSRGLLNSRRESHTEKHERLHLIGFDFDILSSAPMFSLVQCILAAAEEGYCGMSLFDPVRALRTWSWRLDLNTGKLPATAMLVDGRQLTLPAYVRELATVLLNMCESGLITDEIAPQATDMLALVIDLANYADEGSIVQCAKNVSWAAKLLWLTQLCSQSSATLGDAETRLADHDFCHTNPERGAFWRLWEEGMVDPMVTIEDAEACLVEGPLESRDWGRGRIIDKFFDQVADVDWGFVDLRSGDGLWSPRLRVELPQLDSLNKQQFETIIRSAVDPEHLSQLLINGTDAETRQTDPVDDITRELAIVPETAFQAEEE